MRLETWTGGPRRTSAFNSKDFELRKDLTIYPSLLGLTPRHDCFLADLLISLRNLQNLGYGSPIRLYIYELRDWTPAGHAERGVLHCQHGQWGLEALIPYWLRRGSCWTSDPEARSF